MPVSFAKTWNGTVSSSSAAPTQLASPSRWQYLRVTNTSAAGVLYVTADDATSPAAGADTGWSAVPGETVIVPNGLPLWWQGFGGPGGSICPAGPGNPDINPPQSATPADAPNPGTAVWLAVPGGTSPAAIVEGAG
jgi:hypothetical protein